MIKNTDTILDALEKINHTVCLAFNENNNALFNKDKYEHIDCKDIYEFIDCYNIIERDLRAMKTIKEIYFKVGYALENDEMSAKEVLEEIFASVRGSL